MGVYAMHIYQKQHEHSRCELHSLCDSCRD